MGFQLKRRIDYWVGGCLLLLLFPLVRLLALAMRRDHSLSRRKGCVVIKMVGAGSLFLAMPSMQAIRARFPAGSFFLVGTRQVTAFAEGHDWFDATWTIDDSSLLRLVGSSCRAVWRMSRYADHLIDLEMHSRLTTVLGLLSTIRNRIGFVDEIVFWRRGFYTHMTYFNAHGPVYVFYDLLAKWFDVDRIDVAAFHRKFRDRIRVQVLPVELPRRFIAIGHGCSDFGQERQLNRAEWASLLLPMSLAGYRFVFVGGAADRPAAEAIIAEVGQGINLCGELSLLQSTAVLARADGFHGIDSLLLHLARALGIQSVSFWGPTDPATRLRPLETTERIAFASLPCSPCIHVNESPPCQGRRDCMAAAVASLSVTTRPRNPVSVGWDIDPVRPSVRAVAIDYA